MSLGILLVYLHLPGCQSLKSKRSRIKPLLARLHRQFNISAAEIDYLDRWNETLIACALVSNDAVHTRRNLQKIIPWIEHHWPDLEIIDDQIEMY